MKQTEFEFGLNLLVVQSSLEKFGKFPKILTYLDIQKGKFIWS
jgi:hypothetical protein